MSHLWFLAPWDFSPTVLTTCAVAAALYLRGLVVLGARGERRGFWRPFAFLLGLVLTYGVLQTYFDFLSQHMFWVHRLQHLVLHHLAPFLMVVAAPLPVLDAGLPRRWSDWLRDERHLRVLRLLSRPLQNGLIAGLLFVGLVYFWLIPSVHFTAMLDADRYRLMNWSMAVDGMLFWWLMLTPRSAPGGRCVGYAQRLVVLVVTGFLQLFLGAFIVMYPKVLFTVYAVCGRAWAISPITDQQIGGCLTWIPPAMMAMAGVLVVIRHMLHDPEPERPRRRRTGRMPMPEGGDPVGAVR